MDFRLRLYSNGYPFHVQGNRFSRNFLHLDTNKGAKPARYDASQSGISIIAGLMGDIDLLVSTNVLRKADSASAKIDLYCIVMQKMQEFDSKNYFDYPLKYVPSKEYVEPLDMDLLQKLFEVVRNELIGSRDWVKSYVMPLPYSETSYGRITKTKDLLRVLCKTRLKLSRTDSRVI